MTLASVRIKIIPKVTIEHKPIFKAKKPSDSKKTKIAKMVIKKWAIDMGEEEQ